MRRIGFLLFSLLLLLSFPAFAQNPTNIVSSPSSSIATRTVVSNALTGTLTSATCTSAVTTGCVSSTIDGYATATVSVAGTYSGVTLTFELLDANGWQTTSAARLNAPYQDQTVTMSANQSQAWGVSVYGTQGFRVRATTYTSGTVNVSIIFSSAQIDEAPTVSISPSASASALTAATNTSVLAEKGPRWQVNSAPAVSTQATASKAAGGASVRHVVDCVGFSASATTAPALTQVNVNVRDGATGAGTIIRQYSLALNAATGTLAGPFEVCGLNIIGTANTAMTVEFSALVTNVFQSVNISGYDVQ